MAVEANIDSHVRQPKLHIDIHGFGAGKITYICMIGTGDSDKGTHMQHKQFFSALRQAPEPFWQQE